MRKRILPLGLMLLLALTACSGGQGESTPDPSTTPWVPGDQPAIVQPSDSQEADYEGPWNPLTGMPISEEWEHRRPVAVMLNNLKAALPQQGQSKADIIYECLAEGGITRMLGVYQSVEDVGIIGSVRSSRTYYLELALGHDAIYLHAGGSEDAYAKIKSWKVDALDCVRGSYEGRKAGSNLFWRDAERKKNMSSEHTVVTNGEAIQTYLPDSLRRDHQEDYTYRQSFVKGGAPAGGEAASVVSVPFSSYKTGVFTYEEASAKYLVQEYGKDYIDGNTGEQIGVTNVIVLRAACRPTNDSYGHITVDLTSGGDGWFACGGKLVPIRWSKADRDSQFVYTTSDGQPLVLGQGNLYVNIIPTENEISWE